MLFDQNMIIDATTGSIARFVNHSCDPNCRMVKWIVAGKPRMALFAGDRDIMTGEELTYDYNFDPFSAKNVQECRCGSSNCRGILGPRPKDQRSTKDALKEGVKTGKRKLKELLGGKAKSGSSGAAAKKRKITPSKKLRESVTDGEVAASPSKGRIVKVSRTLKKSISSMKKGNLKKSSSSIKVSVARGSQTAKTKAVKTMPKKAPSAKKLGAKRTAAAVKSKPAVGKAKAGDSRKPKVVTVKKTSKKTSILKTYGKNRQTTLGISNSVLAIMPLESSKKGPAKDAAGDVVMENTIQVVEDSEGSA